MTGRMLMGLLLALCLMECCLRLYRGYRRKSSVWGPWRLPSQKSLSFMGHPYALYVKKPNANGLYPSNSLGYAGKRELSPHRLPRSVRIYCVGGSTVEDHDPQQGPDASWPGKLQDQLAPRFPGFTIECINAGTAGYTSAESLAEFLFRGIDLQPDILLVYHNVNDAWTCQMVEGFKSDYSHARRQKSWSMGWVHRLPQVPYVWTYQLLRDWVTRRFGKANALMFWVADPPWQAAQAFDASAVRAFERNITNLVHLAHHWGCAPVLVKWECDWAVRFLPSYLDDRPENTDLYFRYLHANNEVLANLAQRVDYCHYLDVGPFEPHHFSDTIHFSPQGLDAIACRLAQGIEPLVRSIVEARRIEVGGLGQKRGVSGAHATRHDLV